MSYESKFHLRQMILLFYFQALWGMQTPGQAQDQRDAAILANKKKVTKMLFFVVLMFGICWFPFQMFNLLTSLNFELE